MAIAQQTEIYTHDLADYDKALDLYANGQYQAAQTLFIKVKEETRDEETLANCEYYMANAAIRLNQLGADQQMQDFVRNHPTSVKRNAAFMDVADYYFENARYPYALKWYDRAQNLGLYGGDLERYYFRKGYSYFATNNFQQATGYFDRLINSKTYGSQAKYYGGYIAYRTDNYSKANTYFDQVADDEKFREKLGYYQADMNFKLGNFQNAIDVALQYLPDAGRKELSELNKIIGESYFNLEKYEEAIPYLSEYKGKGGKLSNTDLYQLGYAYYKQQDHENAIAQFNKIVEGRDAVAQNAYYHLAECYLKTDKKQQALNAFRNAAQLNFDKTIREDALLNYARLSYDIGNPYENTPWVLLRYLQTYPNSEAKSEVEALLIDSYVTSRDHEAALEVLESTRNYGDKSIYQKVAFYRAIELFTEGNYTEAASFLERSLKEPIDPAYTARAWYWQAEISYLQGDYDEAVIDYKQFEASASAKDTEEYANLFYNLAYTYFKKKDYEQAITYFESYVDRAGEDPTRSYDAYLRIGDSNFVLSKYWPAMEAYNQVIASGSIDVDYATFQKAISYGFVGRDETKLEELEKFTAAYPTSTYRDDALYELGNSYITANEPGRGMTTYNRLVEEHPNSSYVARTLLKQGLIHYNSGANERAISKLKAVVSRFPNSQEAVQAVNTARLVYVDLGQVNEYANWVRTLDFVEVSDVDLDNTTYESAERQYVQNNTKKAIKGFTDYLEQFPQGLHTLQSHFYLAQLYFDEGRTEEAIPHYTYVAEKERNEFTEQALVRLCEWYLNKEEYLKAIPLLTRLEQEADFPQNITFARSNLMKAFYDEKQYSEAITYADKVLKNSKIDNRIRSDAKIIIARASMESGDETKAKQAYSEVKAIATGELAAEALYYEAYFKNKEGQYEASNLSVQQLAKEYSAFKEFGARGLLLMAKNFYALDDAFQATYILESLIENFTEYPSVVSEANVLLKTVKEEEAKRNSSIEQDGN